MSYSVKDTTNKSENVQWFSEVNPAVVDSINSWVVTNVGFVSSFKVSMSSTSLVKIYVFDTQANYSAYLTAADSNAQEIQRKNYNASNGITSSQTVL